MQLLCLAGNELTFPSAEESNLWLIYNWEKYHHIQKINHMILLCWMTKKAWIRWLHYKNFKVNSVKEYTVNGLRFKDIILLPKSKGNLRKKILIFYYRLSEDWELMCLILEILLYLLTLIIYGLICSAK